MTAIVAVSHKSRVWMGGDSSVTDSDTQNRQGEPKVWKRGGMIIGACGDLSVLQHLKHAARWPQYKGQQREKFLAQSLCPELRRLVKALHEQRVAKSDAEPPSIELLIGLGGRLYGIDSDFAYYSAGDAWAIGSGGDAARAILYRTTGEEPEERVTDALESAAAVVISVCEPFTILWQD